LCAQASNPTRGRAGPAACVPRGGGAGSAGFVSTPGWHPGQVLLSLSAENPGLAPQARACGLHEEGRLSQNSGCPGARPAKKRAPKNTKPTRWHWRVVGGSGGSKAPPPYALFRSSVKDIPAIRGWSFIEHDGVSQPKARCLSTERTAVFRPKFCASPDRNPSSGNRMRSVARAKAACPPTEGTVSANRKITA
jgi:hypothetical protein